MPGSGSRRRRPGEIVCRVCGKPSTERDTVNMGRRCRDCFNAWRRNNYRHNPKSRRSILGSQLKNCYGMTLEQWDGLMARQGGKCAICGHEPDGSLGACDNRLHVDHCHTTGKVRALLCHHCNVLLGQAGDDPVLLRRAAEFLESFIELEKTQNERHDSE